MCYGHRESDEEPKRPLIRRETTAEESIGVLTLRLRLAETQVRLARARVREAELNRRLEEMKRFVNVMDIIEGFLRRKYREQQEDLLRLLSSISGRSR